ncbi:sigma-70 family RNA polymerase sigma factor [Alicyclobacillus sp. ALC3]|uniref:sigma-70 family RNA polymerase sigma factor n=1 Tax=Alicyclobacillus sp. ALC3 TaxID=2796143 RepID=UPI0023784BB4|nr:sigma-70 family RNA polymerase sigma factor [Alicyclobacillus sp. ALC3]WDL95898.1 sigma-70 family RNA polymerase sigma factor [Alicyclobacillus sp. ALC3]
MNQSWSSEPNVQLDSLIDAYWSDVWNYVFSLTQNIDVSDDLSQECFIKAYTHLYSFRSESTIKTWLLKIARNLAYDYRRSALFRKVILTDKDAANGFVSSAESEALQKIVTEEVWTLVLSLPRNLREVLVLHGHHQLSVVEISDVLQINERAVRSRLHRARTRMRTLLKEGDIYGGE